MNKQELIGEVATSAGLTRVDAAKAVDAMLDVITSAIKKGDEVRLVGFGSFLVTTRRATTTRNPRTGEEMALPESKQPKFKPGKTLKEAVN